MGRSLRIESKSHVQVRQVLLSTQRPMSTHLSLSHLLVSSAHPQISAYTSIHKHTFQTISATSALRPPHPLTLRASHYPHGSLWSVGQKEHRCLALKGVRRECLHVAKETGIAVTKRHDNHSRIEDQSPVVCSSSPLTFIQSKYLAHSSKAKHQESRPRKAV